MTEPDRLENPSTVASLAPARVLILEDEPRDAELIVHQLRRAGLNPEIRVVSGRREFAEELEAFAPELILADYSLPRFNAPEALHILNQSATDATFIIISGTIGEEKAVECMKLGAADYLLKDRLARLVPAVLQAMEKKNLLYETQRQRNFLQQVNEELKASEAKYRNIVEHIDIGVVLISPQMKILELNRQMRKWFPKARPEDMPLCYSVLNDPPGSGVCDHCPAYAALQDGRVHEFIKRTRVATGVRSFRLVASPIRDDRGQVVAAIETVEDITDRLQMERQLRQAQKMEAIGTLAGGIAHDFNNILSAILGFSELCLDEAGQGSRLHNNLQEVLHAGHRAKDLVHQILAFSRRSETDLKPVQVNLIVKEALKLLRSSLPATIEIVANVVSSALVMGDPTAIHQIVMNLCTNAAYAMEADGGVLTVGLIDMAMDNPVGCGVHLVPGPYLRLTVADSGAGIAPECLDAVFEPYFSTKPEGEGTGLGLSVVHGIVNKLGGGISVRSQPGQGAIFDVYLPVLEPQADVEPVEIQQLPGGTEKVLFVDDEPQIAAMAKQHLERLGYAVEIRTDSHEALELFKIRHADFDLVITDMTMPGMTGDKLAREILKIAPQTPIILCTGFSKALNAQQTAQSGIQAVAMKPLVRSELAQLVRKVLDSGKAGPP